MPSKLTIADIGESREQALETEAALRGVSIHDLVRSCIDEEIARSNKRRKQEEWKRAAPPGFAEEARLLRENRPTLSRFRSGRTASA